MPGRGKNIKRVYVLQHVLLLIKYISEVVFDWLTKMILSHVRNIVFLYVCLNTIFSQWPKALHNTDVYEIK